MTTPKDLIPQRYEVLKLRTGAEIVGMVRDTDKGVEVTLPMMCSLQVVPDRTTTLATFYPYAPLSSDPSVVIPYDLIAHRNNMNNQFVGLYDEASSKWFNMVEGGNIPLSKSGDKVHREYIQKVIDELMESTGGPITEKEERMLERLEEEGWELEDEFTFAQKPTDPKKIH